MAYSMELAMAFQTVAREEMKGVFQTLNLL